MNQTRKLGCLRFNNLVDDLVKKKGEERKKKRNIDDMYQTLQEPVEIIDDGKDYGMMGEVAHALVL